MRHLVGGVHRQGAVLPLGDRRVRFHGGMRLVGRGVGHIGFDLGLVEGRIELADRGVDRLARIRGLGLAGSVDDGFTIETALGLTVVRVLDRQRCGGVAGLLEAAGDDQGNRLAVVVDLAAHQLGLRGDAALADGRADDEAVGRPHLVVFGRVSRLTGDLEPAIDAADRFADSAGSVVVQRIARNMLADFHGFLSVALRRGSLRRVRRSRCGARAGS